MRSPIVIGLVGEKGSGKETFAKVFQEIVEQKKPLIPLSSKREKLLKNQGTSPQGRRIIAHVKFSDLLKETLDLWSLPHTRENLQDLAVIMDQHFGEGTLANAIYERIKKLDADIVLIDGVRWDADIILLNRFKNHYLIYITADLQTRFERIQKRTEKVGEGKSFEQFMKEEGKANEVDIPKLGKIADFKIENDGKLAEFKQKVSKIVRKLYL